MSPELGRFLQPDPIGFKGDASNLYRYCGNDWANKTDPMGLDPIIPPQDIDEAARNGLRTLGQIARSSKDGWERAASIGRENGKAFMGKVGTTKDGQEYGAQRIAIPSPKTFAEAGSRIEPEAGVHVHRHSGQVDANDKPVKAGEKGTLSTSADRLWGDVVRKPSYVSTDDGKIMERYLQDDRGGPGWVQRWDGKKWRSWDRSEKHSTQKRNSQYYLGPQPVAQASNIEPPNVGSDVWLMAGQILGARVESTHGGGAP